MKHRRLFRGLLLSVIVASVAFAEVPYSGEDSDFGIARRAGGVGLVDPYTGNLSFEIHDLSLAGAVGRYGLSWSRVATSRDPGRASFFGRGHNWSHSWQWDLAFSGEGEGAVATVREPSGAAYQFAQDTEGAWQPVSPAVKHKLRAEGEGFALQLLDGMRVSFALREGAAEGGGSFAAREVRDPQSNVWGLSYDDAGRLTQVSEPAGRTLSITYETLVSPTSGEEFIVIVQVNASDGEAVVYQYTFPEGGDYPVLSAVTYPDETQASYAYAAPRTEDRLLLESADDPHADRSIRGRLFVYRSEPEAAFGQLHEIRTRDGEGLFYRLEADPETVPEDRHYAITLDNGAVTYQTYNPGGNLAETIDGSGYTFKTEYDSDGRGQRSTETNELGDVTTYEHDSNGHLIKTTFPDGFSRLQTWDDRGHMLSETDELGNTTTYTYDQKGHLTGLAYPDGSTLSATHNEFGQLLSTQQQNGGVVSFAYDERGLLIEKTNQLGGVASYTYDSHDRLASVTDERGNTTEYKRDAVGRLTQFTYPDGASANVEYDNFGEIVHVVDPTGVEHRFVYDELGREVKSIGANGEVFKTEYAPIGSLAPAEHHPVKQLSPLGRVISMEYDAKGRLMARTTAANTPVASTKHMTYDGAGRLISETDPAGRTVLYNYDKRGRRTQTTTALNHSTTVVYDAVGRKLSETDAAGNVTQWTYDSLGRGLTKTDANGETTTREYDAAGHLITLTDAKGDVHRFEYDLMGNQTALIYPDGSKESSTYDTSGLTLSFTNRSGATRTFEYDNRGREIHSEWSDGTQAVTKAYDAAGRMTLEDNGVSRISFTYDASGRLASQTQDISDVVSDGAFDPEPRTVTYGYNDDGERTTLGYPDGSFISYEYEAHGWLSRILAQGNEPPLASYNYDSVGNATQIPRENTIVTLKAFDDENHLISIVDKASTAQSPINQLSYNYNAVGNRTETERILNLESDSAMQIQEKYSYDAIHQVTGVETVETGTSSTIQFTYDALGNRITVDENGTVTHYAANELNQYTQVGDFSPSYDGNGNLAGMGDWLYRYDALNRLVSATNGTMTAHFWYDARNRVVARSYQAAAAEQPTLTLNTYDDWNLIEERDEMGAQKARYVHGPRIDEIVVMQNEHGTFYPQHGFLGSVTMLTDKDGKPVERYRYSATGEVSIYDAIGTKLAASAIGNRWMYSGREWLPEVGLYDYRNRVYSAQLGRFLQSDPVKFHAKDLNLYRYVNNNFTTLNDPNGLTAGGVSLKVDFSDLGALSFSISFVWDDQSNYDVLVTRGEGVSIGTPGASLSLNYLITNADSIHQLLGDTTAIGMSGALPTFLYFEKEWLWGDNYLGTSGGVGIGTPGGSGNYTESRTWTLKQALENTVKSTVGPTYRGSSKFELTNSCHGNMC